MPPPRRASRSARRSRTSRPRRSAPLGRIKLSCNWMAAAGHPGEDARALRRGARRERCRGRARHRDPRRQGLDVDAHGVARATTATRASSSRRSRSSSPRSGRSTTCARAVTPELRGDAATRARCSSISATARPGSAAACLAQVFGQLGDTPPDLDDPQRLRRVLRRDPGARRRAQARRVPRSLRRRPDRHARSRWRSPPASASSSTPPRSTPIRSPRCSPRSSARSSRSRPRTSRTCAPCSPRPARRSPDRPRGRRRSRSAITHGGAPRRRRHARASCARAGRTSPTRSRAAATTRRAPTRSTQRARRRRARPHRAPHVRSGRRRRRAARSRAAPRPRVAILREQGVNGQIEMAAAFTRAGLRGGRRPHDRPRSRAAPTSPTAAARSRAAGSRSATCSAPAAAGPRRSATTRARATRSRGFVARADTFVLGVCNGCQMIADLAPTQLPGADARGRGSCATAASSSRRALVLAAASSDSPSIFFRGMAGSRIPVANAHGEGRAELDDRRSSPRSRRQRLVAARFVDGRGDVATRYPANPNGSPRGIAALTTARRPDHRRSCRTPSACSAPCSCRGTRASGARTARGCGCSATRAPGSTSRFLCKRRCALRRVPCTVT